MSHGDAQAPADADGAFYTDMGVDILWTGDLAATGDVALESADAYDVEELRCRRGFERYALDSDAVRVSVRASADATGHAGHVANISVTGMWIETAHPLPFRTQVDIDWCVMGHYSMRFPGRVVRATETGMAVVLDVDDTTWRFRSSFVDLARTPSAEPPSVIVQPAIHKDETIGVQSSQTLDLLASQWQQIDDELEDDDRHQAFIHTCLKKRRLEFALERYRELKARNPDSELVTRYLKQIGTILTFYTFQKSNDDPVSPWWKKGILAGLVLIVVAVGSLSIAERITVQTLQDAKPAPELPLPPGARR